MEAIDNLTLAIQALEAQIADMESDFSANNNAFFMCSMALIIFLMQCGFAFLEAGAGWSHQGWMFKGITSGNISTTYVDFAGSGVVHLCGGTISFIAAYMMGPRIGRFPEAGDSSPEIQGHSVPVSKKPPNSSQSQYPQRTIFII
ncbi:hypothetical protein FO519_003719 [Halicephalobus sp. NKZ332]|nr:hypothetical protein FO519_003719 [Halicephalobus sp. NKZ332]